MDGEQMSNGNVVEMTDINCANSETSGNKDKESNSNQNEQKTTQLEEDNNGKIAMGKLLELNGNNQRGSDLLTRRNRDTVASMQIPNIDIQHDNVCVELQDADGDEEEEEKVDKKDEDEDEIQVSSPMMVDKPAEMRPYSVAVDVMFTRKDTKSKKKKKMGLIVLAILLAVLLIGGTIAVLVIFLGDIGGPEPEMVAIQGEFRLTDRTYSSAYTDSESPEFQQLQQEFITEMDTLYMNSTYKDIYIKTEVSGFRDGSVVVAFVVQLMRMDNEISPPDDSDDTTDPDDNETNDVLYREALDFIFTSVEKGTLGKLTGTVINLTLILGDGKPVERVTPKFSTPTNPVTTSGTSKTTTVSMTTNPMNAISTTQTGPTTPSMNAISTTQTGPTTPTTMNAISTTQKEPERTTVVGSSPSIGTDSEETTTENEPDTSTNDVSMTPLREMSSNQYITDVITMETMPDDDNPPDLCVPNPCMNGGNCTAFSLQTHCTCPDDFYGMYCEMATMSYISSDYTYDSSLIDAPIATNFPIPGHMFECKPVEIAECLALLPFNMSTTPNPHGLGNTVADIRNQYDMLSMYINDQCHPDATRVLCSLLHTKCTDDTSNIFMAFLETYIPCRSLCLEIDEKCLDSGGPIHIFEICDPLPESADSSICYRPPSTSGPLSCTPDLCLNNGSCLVIMSKTMCRCQEGFIGERCETRDIDPCLSSPCRNGGECQPEPPAIPGTPLIYICKCQSGFFGKHCENVDENTGMVDVPDVPNISQCGSVILISECADIVPYNISNSATVNADQYTGNTMDWGAILSMANMCHENAGVFICAVLQRKCTDDGPILPCRALCERVSNCDLSSSALPYNARNCETYSDSLNNLDCFDVTYG